jgi:hypothetical protein
MSKENQIKTEIVDQLVLVHDPILGSRYELQSVEVYAELDAPETESNEG